MARHRFNGEPGPGRPLGSKNKTTLAKEQAHERVVEKLASLGTRAVEVLAEALEADDLPLAVKAAGEVLDRLTPKLKAVEHAGDAAPPALLIDMRAPERPRVITSAAEPAFEALPITPAPAKSARAPRGFGDPPGASPSKPPAHVRRRPAALKDPAESPVARRRIGRAF
jgi:hypothetical protein